LDLPVAIKRASLANPDVADTVVLSPTQLYITGKSTGVTNLTLWNESGKMMGMYDVVIAPDLTRLKENLHKAMPDEKNILVMSSHDSITLSGTASSAGNLTRAMSIAEAYAPRKVINSLQVGGVQQVMLEVRVAEMNRELIRRLGINATAMTPQGFGMTAFNDRWKQLFRNEWWHFKCLDEHVEFIATSARRKRRVSISNWQYYLVWFRRCFTTGEYCQSAGETNVVGVERSGSGLPRRR
jgi:hypothetical protein